MCNESKLEVVLVHGDRKTVFSVAQPQLQRALYEECVSKQKPLTVM